MTKTIRVNDLPVEVRKKNIKHINLRIYPPDGRIKVSAPWMTSHKNIIAFILSKQEWIEKQLIKIKTSSQQNQQKDLPLKKICFLGNPLDILYRRSETAIDVIHSNHQLIVTAPHDLSSEQKQLCIEHWCKQQMALRLPQLIAKWAEIIQVPQPQWRIRKMKTRWGSCNPQAQRISLNQLLIHKPLACLEYVIVHELVHLIEPSHNRRFYELMSQFMPHWKMYKKLLATEPPSGF